MSSNIQRNHSDILKEQGKLVKLETELTKMLSTINQHINTLKVEEHQLRSNKIQQNLETKQIQKIEEDKPANFADNPCDVNSQEIDLDLIIKKFEEEDDSD